MAVASRVLLFVLLFTPAHFGCLEIQMPDWQGDAVEKRVPPPAAALETEPPMGMVVVVAPPDARTTVTLPDQSVIDKKGALLWCTEQLGDWTLEWSGGRRAFTVGPGESRLVEHGFEESLALSRETAIQSHASLTDQGLAIELLGPDGAAPPKGLHVEVTAPDDERIVVPVTEDATASGGALAGFCKAYNGYWEVVVSLNDVILARRRVLVPMEGGAFVSIRLARSSRMTFTGAAKPGSVSLETPWGERWRVVLPWTSPSVPEGIYALRFEDTEGGARRVLVRNEAKKPARVDLNRLGHRSRLLIAGQAWQLPEGTRSVVPGDAGAMTFERYPRYKYDPVETLSDLREVVRKVVLHTHPASPDCASNVADLRKHELVDHLCIEWDGTLYQLVDVVSNGSGGATSDQSVQVTLVGLMPNLYDKVPTPPWPDSHPRLAEMKRLGRKLMPWKKINGGRVKTHGLADTQYRTLSAVVAALTFALPKIERRVPRTASGEVVLRFLHNAESFAGVVGHFHLSETRWDPGPAFDWDLTEALLGWPTGR